MTVRKSFFFLFLSFMKSEILIFGNSDKLRAIAGVGKWRERPHHVSSARLPPNPVPLLSFTLFVSISQTSVWFCCGRFFSLQPNGSFPKYLVRVFYFFWSCCRMTRWSRFKISTLLLSGLPKSFSLVFSSNYMIMSYIGFSFL